MQKNILRFAIRFSGLGLLVGFLFTGCLYPNADDWKRCSFDIVSLQYKGSRENQTEWEITLLVHNPTSDRLKMESVKAFALQNGDTLGTLNTVVPLDLAPEDSTLIVLHTSLPQSTWDKLLQSLRRDGVAHLTITGEAYYKGMFGVQKVPGLFRKNYDLDLNTALNAMGSNLLQSLQSLPFFH